jgi:hypothetical protein
MKVSLTAISVIASGITLANGFQMACPARAARSLVYPTILHSATEESAESKESEDNNSGKDEDKKMEVEESAALKWAETQKKQLEEVGGDAEPAKKKKKYVVVGAGWGGWGAAKVRPSGVPTTKF